MRDNTFERIKNKSALIVGTVAGLLIILTLPELFQGGVAAIFNSTSISFEINIISIIALFDLPEGAGVLLSIFILVSPAIFIFLFMGITSLILKLQTLGFYRYSLLLVQVFLIGHLIVYVFYGALNVVLNFDLNNDWIRILSLFDLQVPIKIAIMFLVIIVFIVYMNFSSRRILKIIGM